MRKESRKPRLGVPRKGRCVPVTPQITVVSRGVIDIVLTDPDLTWVHLEVPGAKEVYQRSSRFVFTLVLGHRAFPVGPLPLHR